MDREGWLEVEAERKIVRGRKGDNIGIYKSRRDREKSESRRGVRAGKGDGVTRISSESYPESIEYYIRIIIRTNRWRRQQTDIHT